MNDPSTTSKDSEDPDAILLNGIQEITNTLLENYEINDALTMILETMYRGFRFHHVLLCLLDKRRANVAARFGFGENIARSLRNFNSRLTRSPPTSSTWRYPRERILGSKTPRIRV